MACVNRLHKIGGVARVGIIADDLTSAADGGAPFARAGHRVLVGFGSGAPPSVQGGDVVALDLDSRAGGAAAASALAAEAGLRLRRVPLLIKTVDSTLRGHVGAEVAAVLLASGRRVALVAPAFPAAGRTTRDGMQLVDGVPVHRTAFAHDPRHPVSGSRVADLFLGAGLEPVAELAGADVRDQGRVRTALAAARVVVADAGTDADLDALVASAIEDEGVLWIGSPGIAQALARASPARRTAPSASAPDARSPLVLVGSLHPASRAQVGALVETLGARPVEIDAGHAASDTRGAEIERACAVCRDEAGSGRPVVVLSAPVGAPGAAGAVASVLAEVGRRLVAEGLVDGLVATGGDTARAAARALGAEALHLLREPEPGVALGEIAGPHPLPVITKAGGFGDTGALVRLCAALQGLTLPASEEAQPA